MNALVKFSPKETTREQRQVLSDQAAALNAMQGLKLSAFAEQLNQRYIEGAMSIAAVNAQLDAHCQACP